MNEASRREIIRSRTSEALNDSRFLLKDAGNIRRQSEVLGDSAAALVEKLRCLREESRLPREIGNQRWKSQAALPAGTHPPVGTSARRPLADQFSAAQLLMDPLPGVVTIQFIRCGKRGCHCETGQKHGPYFYRVWRDKGGRS